MADRPAVAARFTRRPWMGTAAAAVPMMAGVLLLNLGGRQLNELTLRMPGVDKFLHFVEYAAVFLVLRGVARSGAPLRARRDQVALAGALAIALVDETLQRWSPGRNVEMLDVASNVSGIAFGWSIVRGVTARAVAMGTIAMATGAYLTFDSHLRTRDFAHGLKYEREGSFAVARAHYQRALAAGLRSDGLYNSLGWVEIESGQGDPVRAVTYAQTALASRPDNADYLDTYGWALHHAGRHEEALQALRKAYARDPEIFCIHYHLGSTYLALGHLANAKFHFERQVERSGTREAARAARALETMAVRP